MPTIAVVIPNWNGRKLIGDCLRSLRKQALQPLVIVVDNGSADGSAEYIKQYFPNVTLVELDKNYGFAGGVNAGIKAALKKNCKYIALLNNDAVAEKDWLRQLVNTLEKHPKTGIVTSKILDSKGKKLDSTGDMYSVWGTPFPRGRGEVDKGQYDSSDQQEIFAASGGASLYRARMFKHVGLFDERFFAYYEDVDVSYRAQLAGWSVRYQPKARVLHQIGATAKKLGDFQQYHMLKNYFYLYFKNMPGKLFWKYLFSVSIGFWGRVLTLLAKGKFKIVLKALGAIIIHKPGLLLDRYKIQRQRRASTANIDNLLYHKPSPSQSQKIPFRWFSK